MASWIDPRPNDFTEAGLRARLKSLQDWLKNPSFNDGVNIGSGAPPTYDPATGTVAPPPQSTVTGQNISVSADTATSDVFTSTVTGDTYARFILNADGSTETGDGAAAPVLSSYTREFSTAFGRYAGAADVSSTPTYLTAVGMSALRSNTTGSFNSAVGESALYANTTGSDNTAIGDISLSSNTTGTNNSAVGVYALGENTTGSRNSAVGSSALESNTTGTNNSAVGVWALGAPAGTTANATTTGLRQTAIGVETGQSSATQRNDVVCVGYRALVDGNNAIAIGSGTSAGAAGAVAIGKDSANTSASTTVTDEIKLGTALHTVNIIGSALVGGSTTELVAFHGAAGVAQRAGAAQAAVDTTAATQTTPWGFSSAAQADGIVTLLNEIRAALVEKGLIKGAA